MTTSSNTKTPDGVVLSAIWFLIGAVFALIGIVALLVFAYPAVLTETARGFDRYMAVAGVSFGLFIIVLLGAVDLAAAVGLLRLRPWGRVLAIVLAALGILAFPIGTIAGGLIIWYLLSDEAKQAFGVAPPPVPDSPAGLEATTL